MLDLKKYRPGNVSALLVAQDWMSAKLHGQAIRELMKASDSPMTTLSWLDKVFEEHERYYYDILCAAIVTVPED